MLVCNSLCFKFENFIKNMKNTLIILINLLLFVPKIINAGEPVYLEFADTLAGEQDSTSNIRKLIGNVRLRQGNVRLTCDKAIQYMTSNKFDLIGNVVIKQNTITLKAKSIYYDGDTYLATSNDKIEITDKETKLTADRGIYSTATLIADFQSNVVVEDDSVVIYSDFIRHNRNDGVSNAWGNVLIEGKHTVVLVAADSVLNIPAGNYSKLMGSAQLFQIDSVGGAKSQFDTLTISSDIMEAYRDPDNERYLATGSVEIIRGNMLAKAETGKYFKNAERIELLESPKLWYDATQLSADTIIVSIPNKKLSNIEAISKALSVSLNDSTNIARKDQLSGNLISISFEQDSLKMINSKGNAKSLYFISTDGEPDGLISVGAENITIRMSEGKAKNIVMTEKVPGEYVPEPIVKDKEAGYNLPGFKYFTDKPEKLDMDKVIQRKSRK